jgi:Domain of unknown function (DUF5916)/Carbohydrate family 9 binding domain-like
VRGVHVAVLALLLSGTGAAAQEPDSAAAPRTAPEPRKEARAVRVAAGAVSVDGRLDEEVWRTAPAITGFVQRDPAEGAPATRATEVRIAYDDQALYVGARMHAAGPRDIQAPVSRRDNASQSEYVLVSLDTYHDRRTAYSFGVTAAGTRIDRYHPLDSDEADDTFDPVWEAEAAVDSAGWTAEMRIPFSQLRFSPGSSQTWGINVRRWVPSKEEDDYWIVVPRSVRAWASRFGDLTGIEGVRPARRVELSPYAAAGAALRSGVHPRDPFADEREAELRAGADLKVGLGPNLTLDATVNPDFGQVEADPAEVNLSAFESVFGERRPFFTEGSQLLSGGGSAFFYSRRIGAAPRGPAEGDFVDRPDATTILGAAKLTGRLPSGLSVGVLGAVTGREHALTFDTATGARGRVEVEPLATWGVARLQQEVGRSGSAVGATLTGVRRGLEEGTPLAARLARTAVSGGADATLRLGGGAYEVYAAAGFSHVAGDSLAVLRLQRASARYFQRPDADYVELDPSRTSLSGFMGSLSAAKISGTHWLWEAGVSTESPGYELNDVGRLTTADGVAAYAQLRYRETRPRGPFRRYDLFVTPSAEWSYGGVRTDNALFFDADAVWKNHWRTIFTLFHVPRVQSLSLTRGGPLAGAPSSSAAIFHLLSSSASRLRWNARVYYGENELGRPTYRLSGGVSVRPGPRWQLSVDPNYLRTVPVRQYVATFEGGPAETFGKTYVFAAVDRSELFAQLRLSYLFTPDLSLELYAEPFASSGRYHHFGVLPAARSHALRSLTPEEAAKVDGTTTVRLGGEEARVSDFNVRSFRSNAVLRWEWRPGSTLFVVWQQDRSGERDRIALVGPGSLVDALRTRGDNFLVVKASYWIPVR